MGPNELSQLEVAFVTFNSAGHVAAAIESVVAAGLPSSRVTVVDNASTDSTREMAQAEGAKVLPLSTNRGFAAACNAALAATDASFVGIANPDVRLDPACLRHLTDGIAAADDGIAVAPVLRSAPAVRKHSTLIGDLVGMTGLWRRRPFRRLARDRALPRDAKLIEVDYAEGALLVLRREPALQLGGFDERYFLYSEEEDFCRRAKVEGWSTYVVPAAKFEHLATSSSAGFRPASAMPMRLRSRCLYFEAHRGRAYAFAARLLYTAIAVLHRVRHRASKRESAYPPETVGVLWSSKRADRYVAAIGRDRG